MTRHRKAWLAAGLLAGAAALTGCAAGTTPVATPTPKTAQQVTAQPDAREATASPVESPQTEETPGPLALSVDGKTLSAGAIVEEDGLLLPLEETAKALGWSYEAEEKEEESLVRKSVFLRQGDSQITISWSVTDNTVKGVTWQKDGLLIPVDTRLTTLNGTLYVPAAFFETAMRAGVDRRADAVEISTPAPLDTPGNDAQSAGENAQKDNS